MRAQLGALAGGQRLFEQCPENRRFNLGPVGLGGFQQFAAIGIGQAEGLRRSKQPAVEIADLAADRRGIAFAPAAAHRLPQCPQFGFERRLVGHRLFKESGETAAGQQADIFGEHAENDAHQEQRGFLDRQAALAVAHAGGLLALQTLKPFRYVCQPLGDPARDFGRPGARIDAGGIGPDRREQRPRLVLGKPLDLEAVGMLIGEVAIAAAVARPVEIKLEGAADVADNQERRPGVVAGQVDRIALGLGQGIAHQLVITRARWGSRGAGRDVEQFGLLLVGIGQFGLLGFEDEAALLVEVNGPGAAPRAAARHRTFELVGTQRAGCRRLGQGQAQRVAEIIDELAVIGALRPALDAQPFEDELLHVHSG